ncbi:hypothetical protein [Rhizobium acidisoli]|uniref:hypothetical protein n=1 Tax=Rhizobium acidisoli TaxID=1538158 RepID=UPI003159B58B
MKNIDQIVMSDTTPVASRRAARISRGYSLEELAIATGLTVAEIAAAEELANSAGASCRAHRARSCLAEGRHRELRGGLEVIKAAQQTGDTMNRRKMLTGFAAAAALPTLLSSTFVHAQSHSPAMGDAEKKHAEDTKKVGSLSWP